MCGIIGITSKNKHILPQIIEGLKALEYRGYDSAGIAYFKNKEIKIIKEKGAISELEKKVDINDDASVAIAHTRWATHGIASATNAHPHKVNHTTIVHNGIIENFISLKEMLLAEGYTFKTETDTEVACALLDFYYQEYKDIDKTIKEFMKNVIGSYAILMMLDNDDKTIYAIKKDSPLIIGINKQEETTYLASDLDAILKHTKDYYIVDDLEYAKVTNTSVTFYNQKGKIEKELKTYQGDVTTSLKGKYEHFMMMEIMEQKTTILKTIEKYIKNGLESLKTLPDLTNYNEISIVACGTAYHAGLVAKYLFREYTNTKCEAYLASEYRYQNNFFSKDTLTIFISQSGETADTLASLKMVKEHNLPNLSIINVKESSIARYSDITLYTEAGKEIAVASTKAYTAQVALLSVLALSHAMRKKTMSTDEILQIIHEYQNIDTYINPILENTRKYQTIAKQIYKTNDIFYIGRGLDYALSMEGSLKLKEISYIHSEAYAAGELKHGTISLISKDTPVFSSCNDDKLNLKTISNLKEVIARGANVYLITSDQEFKDDNFKTILIPDTSIFIRAITTIIIYQFIAYYTAYYKGTNIDKPKNLAKSVTVE